MMLASGSEIAQPVLSVVTPVLNGRTFLPACLESVRRAARLLPGAIEHIIADGGSSDGSLDLIRSHMDEAGSPIVRIYEGPDRGQSHAINRGLAGAKGRYVAWLNADDVYEPRALVSVLDAMRGSSAGLHLARASIVDGTGREIYCPVPPEPLTPEMLLRLLTVWFAGRSIIQPEAFIRRDVWDTVGGLREANHHSMDHELWLRLAEHGVDVVRHVEVVARQLAHPAQKTSDNAAVVRSMLEYAEPSARRLRLLDSPAGDEIGMLRARLRTLDAIHSRAGRDHARAAVADRAAWSAIWSDARPALRGLLAAGAGIVVDAPRSWSAADLHPGAIATRVSGRLPALPSEAAWVLAFAPTLRYGAGAVGRIASWLRPKGRAVLLMEPQANEEEARVFVQRFADALTQPIGVSLLDGESDRLVESMLLAKAAWVASEPTGTPWRVLREVHHAWPLSADGLPFRPPRFRSYLLER
ncbi:MAG: glycosyltransferase [Planctomycetota bacterium]